MDVAVMKEEAMYTAVGIEVDTAGATMVAKEDTMVAKEDTMVAKEDTMVVACLGIKQVLDGIYFMMVG